MRAGKGAGAHGGAHTAPASAAHQGRNAGPAERADWARLIERSPNPYQVLGGWATSTASCTSALAMLTSERRGAPKDEHVEHAAGHPPAAHARHGCRGGVHRRRLHKQAGPVDIRTGAQVSSQAGVLLSPSAAAASDSKRVVLCPCNLSLSSVGTMSIALLLSSSMPQAVPSAGGRADGGLSRRQAHSVPRPRAC